MILLMLMCLKSDYCMRYLLPLFECEIETMMLKTKYYRKKDYFIIIIVYLVMSLPYINKRQIIIY